MALSLLLLISSGLFLRSLQGATEIDPGFDEPKNIVMASLDPGLQGYEEVRARDFLNRITEEIGALPEVSHVGLTGQLPLGLGSSDTGVTIPGYDFGENEPRNIHYVYVGEGYLETMGIDLVEGRTYTRADDADRPARHRSEQALRGPVLARRVRPGQDRTNTGARAHRDRGRGNGQVHESRRGPQGVHVPVVPRTIPLRHGGRRTHAHRSAGGPPADAEHHSLRGSRHARLRRAHHGGPHGHRAPAHAARCSDCSAYSRSQPSVSTA